MRRFSTLLFAAAGILPGPAGAQSAPATLDELVVVTATLEVEERREVPASVSVVDAEEISNRQETEILGLLATLPGMTVVQSGSPGSVASLFTRGTDSNHTLVLWNGVPLNDPSFGGFDWAFLPTDGVERVEAVRGPFSALYGSNALGGVVQIFSSRQDGGRARLESGKNGYRRGSIAAGWTRGGFRLDISGHLRRGDGETENDFYDGEGFSARAAWSLGEGAEIGLLARVQDTEIGIPSSFGVPSPERRQGFDTREIAVPFLLVHDSWELDGRLSRATTDFTFRDPDDLFRPAANTEAERVQGRLVYKRSFGDDVRGAFGGEWDRQEVTDTTPMAAVLDGETQRTWAVFGETSFDLGRWRLDVGLRRDDNTFFGGETSPKIGVAVELSDRVSFHVSFGEAFRAPAVSELRHPFFGNAALEPETTESFEIGLDLRGGRWSARLAGFENRLTNLIDFDFATFVLFNVGRAETRGLEGDLAFHAGPFDLKASATLLSTEDLDTGLELLRRPEKNASFVVGLRPGDWSLSLVGLYAGDRADIDPETFGRAVNPSHVRFDLAARWDGPKRVAPYARIENLAGEEYQEALGFEAPGRSLIGGLAVKF